MSTPRRSTTTAYLYLYKKICLTRFLETADCAYQVASQLFETADCDESLSTTQTSHTALSSTTHGTTCARLRV